MITPLKHWSLNRTLPTIDDTESLSVLELVGKNTTKINEIVNDYNKFVDLINKEIESFENETNKNFEEFTTKIEKITHDYIIAVNLKVAHQDKEIADAVSYMKTNLGTSITQLIIEMRESGELSEDILNALEDFTTRLTNLEEKSLKIEGDISSLDERLTAEENKEIYFIYDGVNKELRLNVNVREVI